MIHIAKLAVGVRDIDHLRTLQRDRAATGRLCHRTRHAPRRRDEILCGGSLFWVIGGLMRVRQRIVGIDPDLDAAGLACAALLLDPVLTVTEPRPTRAFQGWRYLDPGAAPADIDERGNSSLPGCLERELRALALL